MAMFVSIVSCSSDDEKNSSTSNLSKYKNADLIGWWDDIDASLEEQNNSNQDFSKTEGFWYVQYGRHYTYNSAESNVIHFIDDDIVEIGSYVLNASSYLPELLGIPKQGTGYRFEKYCKAIDETIPMYAFKVYSRQYTYMRIDKKIFIDDDDASIYVLSDEKLIKSGGGTLYKSKIFSDNE